tara:strand:- start:37033 stop:37200 length:168 start_codon:yes stop_codon:yes gene_type:complete
MPEAKAPLAEFTLVSVCGKLLTIIGLETDVPACPKLANEDRKMNRNNPFRSDFIL